MINLHQMLRNHLIIYHLKEHLNKENSHTLLFHPVQVFWNDEVEIYFYHKKKCNLIKN
jgi:hypothetical protein